MNKSTKLLSAFCAISCATMLSSNVMAATGDSDTWSNGATVTEIVRINDSATFSVPGFEPDEGVAAVSDTFCLYSNDNANNYPSADIVASTSSHEGAGSGTNSGVEGLKFNLTIASNKLILDGEDGTTDKHVLDYIATVTTLGDVEATNTECDINNYKLAMDINDNDAKEAMAGAYAGSVNITVAVRL